MFQSINEHQFRQAFADYGRIDNFTYDGLTLLFDYLEEYEESTGQAIELDVIALCCEYDEDTLENINAYYEQDFEDLDDAARWLADQTAVVGITEETVVYQSF